MTTLSPVARPLASGCLLGMALVYNVAGHAELPPPPVLAGFASPQSLQPQAQAVADHTEVVSGQVTLFVSARRAAYQGRFGMPLEPGDVLQTAQGPESRCRVVFANGDVLHLGPDTLLGIDARGNDGRVANLWHGQIVAYAMPTIEGRDRVLVVQAPGGSVELKAGKVGISTDGTTTELAVFHNVALLKTKASAIDIGAGKQLRLPSETFDVGAVPQDLEARLTALVSPEVPAVTRALAAFRNKDLTAAREIFAQVRTSFPYNSAAAYYLGLIELDEGKLPGAIREWKRYTRIDPAGAKQKDVQRHLTVLVSQQIKEEVQAAIANEQHISASPPEPNSIAVHPLRGKGSGKYQAIGKGLTAMVISDIAKVPGLKVLEREKIQKLLDEIKLSEAGLVARDTAVRSGRLLRAEKLMVGDYAVEPAEETPNE